ncbi:hypothetical protein GH714_023884 [Hevea brasiliensis]|uniref:F-box protein At3g26010-like beta-propeller domain-containing protein n=1 Tax=Hevea brasiliensis TaxID=3981 RepID=A0A6A6MZD1_HEVBR|nr:hypothetical protein GH714_023884 [Hevea brasiliensis]
MGGERTGINDILSDEILLEIQRRIPCKSAVQRIFDQVIYYICNPITKQWSTLPPDPRRYCLVPVGFVCNPYYQIDNRDVPTIDSNLKYKGVGIPVRMAAKCEFGVELFSSETGQWTDSVLLSPKPIYWSTPLTNAIVYNGLLHWLTRGNEILV